LNARPAAGLYPTATSGPGSNSSLRRFFPFEEARWPLVAAFVGALGLLGTVAWSDWRQFRRMEEAAALVAKTHEVQAGLNRLLSVVQDVETGSRGFVLTGDRVFLEPFEAGLKAAVEEERRIEQLILADEQKANLRVLESLIANRIAVAGRTVELRQDAGFEAAQHAVASGQGEALMGAVRAQLARMDAIEQTLLDQRSAALRGEANNTVLLSIGGIGVSAALFVVAFALVLRGNRRRQRVQRELDRFFTLSLDMLCIAGTDGYFKRLSPAFRETLGYTTDELRARPFLDFVHPDDRAATLAEMEKLSQGVPTVRFENRYQCQDGSWRWLSWKTQPVVAEGLLYATARDVTELRRAQEALSSSDARYHTLFSSIDEGFCIIEMLFDEQDKPVDYRFVEVNPSFEKQTGLRDALGKRMRELAPGHEEHWFEIYGHIATTGEAVRFQNRAEQLHRSYDVYAFRFGEPKQRQVAILFRDITERKEAEAKIIQLNADLQERAAQLTEANQELESFSYSVSHDLRAPLRHVHGYVEMLQRATDGQLSQQAQRYLNTITEASVEMGQLIDDLLAFSRMSRTEMRDSHVPLDELMQDTIRGLEMATTGRNIVWQIASLPAVVGDPSLLRQVLTNLIGNAVKYSRTRDPAQIEIGCAGEEDGRIILFVRDNGAGFDMQYAHKLFGVFQRLHRADEFEGTGIGLATVRRIVARHGGRVWAEGVLDQGATFYCTLKRSPSA